MPESFELGSQLRDFFRGLTGDAPSERRPPNQEWGPRVDLTRLQDRYAPQRVEPFTATPGGIDNLALHSTDTFTVPDHGEFTVDFRGYFRVAREQPSTDDWETCEVLVNIIDLRLFASHIDLGEISVQLNPDVLSSGQIFPATAPGHPKACRIATAAIFDLPGIGLSVFNKEPVLLMNENVTSIPPVDDPNGHALIFRLPLFNVANSEGGPVAYLTSLRYGADNYLSESEAESIRSR